jgi:aryl-alcohol dehydrogenase-like predicted oxidoreductase
MVLTPGSPHQESGQNLRVTPALTLTSVSGSRLARLFRIGSSAEGVPRLGFGCEQLGGYEWGNVDVPAVENAVATAYERGVRLFDTADCYGKGMSEERLGRLLAPVRNRVFIATKFGVRFNADGKVYYDSSPQWAEEALYQSLTRLCCDYIDLYQVHYWDGSTPLEETFERLEDLRARGSIRAYGITNYISDVSKHCDQFPGFATVSAEYSLVERSAEAAARKIAATGLTFLSHGSLGQGVLSGKYQAGHRFEPGDRRSRSAYRHFHGEQSKRNLGIIRALRQEAGSLAVTLPQLALAWIMNRIPLSVPLVGIKNVAQIEEAIGALEIVIPPETMARIDALTRVLD